MQHALTPLLDLADRYSALLMGHRAKLLPFCLELLSPPNSCLPDRSLSPYKPAIPDNADPILDYDAWTELATPAAGIILTLAESWPNEIGAWERGKITREMIPLMVAWIIASLARADNEDWRAFESTQEAEEESLSFPEECLERLVEAMGELFGWGLLLIEDGRVVFAAITALLPSLMQSSDWRYPYAGLRLIGKVVPSLAEVSQPIFNVLLTSSTSPLKRTSS
jgi:hypothetical protein